MEHEGKMYCHQHYPPAVAKRNESSLIAWREKWNAEVELSNHKNAAARLLARFTASQLVNAPDVETLLAAESSINRPEEAASD
jgi:hypothetical protein